MAMQTKTAEKVSKVRGLIEGGLDPMEACKKAKLSRSLYYKHVKPKAKKVVPEYTPMVIQSSTPAMLVVGTADQIAEVMRGYNA